MAKKRSTAKRRKPPNGQLSARYKRDLVARLRKVRGKRSRSEVSTSLGISIINWGQYENGLHLPSFAVLNRLARVEKVNLNWLVTGKRG